MWFISSGATYFVCTLLRTTGMLTKTKAKINYLILSLAAGLIGCFTKALTIPLSPPRAFITASIFFNYFFVFLTYFSDNCWTSGASLSVLMVIVEVEKLPSFLGSLTKVPFFAWH
jgi:hypothetical protein